MTFCRSTSSTPAAGVRVAGGGDTERDPDPGETGDLRERFPRIRLRGDSHYACPEVMSLRSLCDRVQRTRKRGCAAGVRHRVHLRPGRNRSPGGAGLKAARRRAMPHGRATQVQAPPLHGLPGQVLELPAPDRVEAGPDGVDTRYIVTNLTDRRAQRLYERKYCQRGRTC
jgi:hypothetical protein